MDLLVISNESPYSTSSAIDALEAALAATNIGLEVSYLFKGEGVLQLVANQQPTAIGHKSTFKRLALLPLFDIEPVYICKKSIEQYGVMLEQVDFDYELVDDDRIQQTIQRANSVLNF